MKTYRGHVGDSPTVTVDDAGGPRILKPKNEEIGFAWGDPYEGCGPGQLGMATEEEAAKVRQRQRNRAIAINQTILVILTDLLGNEEEAVKVYQRVKHLTVLRTASNQPLILHEAQLRKMIEEIEQRERETAHLRKSHYVREVVSEVGGGVVWDTDDQGRRRGPR